MNTVAKQLVCDSQIKASMPMEEENKPDPAKAAAELQANFDEQCNKAAAALAEADILLLVTGAGFIADSGLAVYSDIGKVPAYQERGLDYADVSQPIWVDKDPELFYGFWGQAFNDYRATKPHEGYDIIARWRDDKNKADGGKIAEDIRACTQSKVESQRPFDSEETQLHTPYVVTVGPAGAFYSFTSNADAHFYDKFEAHEIHDCHGNVELWQCSSRDCSSGIWRAPMQHKFAVDKQTMLAPQNKKDFKEKEERISSPMDDNVPHIGHTTGSGQRTELLRYMPASKDTKGWLLDEDSTNWPKCGHCQSLARPAIFMFGDFGWKYDRSQAIRWDLWREVVLELSEGLKVCIVEAGCGIRVATCRTISEQMVEDVAKKGGNVKLVRINPDFPSASD